MTGTAIITGGAGGIASALAPRLQKRGYRLVLLDHDTTRLQAAAAALGNGVRIESADLTQADHLDRAARMIAGEEALELLVNTAGIILPGDVADLPDADMERQIAINLLAPMRLSKAAAQRMKAQRSGCILSIVSAAGFVALPGSAAYSASKFGLRGYLLALSQELAPHGVRVRGVFPGAVDTPMLRYEATHGGSPLNFLNKDVLTPDQVAEACLKAMDGPAVETLLPAGDAVWSRLLVAAPGLMPKLLPSFLKRGERGKARYLASRGLSGQPDLSHTKL